MEKVSGLDREQNKYGELLLSKIDILKAENCVNEVTYNRFGHHTISFKASSGKGKELSKLWKRYLLNII